MYLKKQNLKNKIALVTGAGKGLGKACAIALAEAGANLIIISRTKKDLDAVSKVIKKYKSKCKSYVCDVTNYNEIKSVIYSQKRIDILVNNAGYIWHSAIHNMTDDQWDAMLDIHVSAQFRILRAYGKWLRANADRNSHIRKVVNISSTMGLHGGATQLAYSAGKAAVVGLTKTLAKEWGRFNVTVNAVAFGAIDTRLTSPYDTEPNIAIVKGQERKVGLSLQQIEDNKAASPLGKIGSPEDAANAIYLMCIPESDWITGEVLLASGGVRY